MEDNQTLTNPVCVPGCGKVTQRTSDRLNNVEGSRNIIFIHTMNWIQILHYGGEWEHEHQIYKYTLSADDVRTNPLAPFKNPPDVLFD